MLFEKLLTTGGVKSKQQLYAWGDNSYGELGDNTEITKSSPVKIGTKSWRNVAVGQSFTVALQSDQTLWTWGNNQYGQLGNGTVTLSFVVPTSYPSGLSWTRISSGGDHSLGIKSDGTLWAWGANGSGQLGNLNTATYDSPVLVSGPTGASWQAVASANSSSLALTTNGVLYAWGSNNGGLLGANIADTQVSSPVVVSGAAVVRNWKTVSAGDYSAFGIQTDGTLWAWGFQQYNELGTGLTTPGGYTFQSPTAVVTPAGVSWSIVAAGASHSLALDTTGQLYAWGYNDFGQSTSNSGVPALVSGPGGTAWPAGTSFTSIDAGQSHSLATTKTGLLYAWGGNTQGQLGTNNTTTYSYPQQVSAPAGLSFSVVSAGYTHSTAIATTGALYAWGANASGQIGNTSTTGVSSPIAVQVIQTWKMVTIGGVHSAGIQTDGSLWVWGDNTQGQLGTGSYVATSSPVKLGLSSWATVAAGNSNTFGITSSGQLYAWGRNGTGQLGINSAALNVNSPVQVSGPPGTSWTGIAAGFNWSVGITSQGILYSWGNNTWGQLGNLSLTQVSSPVLVSGPAGTSWSLVACGGSHSLAVTSTGVLYAWGLNSSGQLGILSIANSSSPVVVSGFAGTTVRAIAAGLAHSLAITSLGALYAWGLGTTGQLGDGTIVSKSSPVKIGSSSWSAVGAGASHSLAFTSVKALYGWGLNTSGQVGVNTLTSISSPVLVSAPAGTSWTAIAAGGGGNALHSLGIDTAANTLYGWGLNTSGQVGIASLTTTSSPVVVQTPQTKYSWSAVAAGGSHTLGITTLGSLFAWGGNGSGQLGNLGTTNQSYAIPITSPVSSWTAVAAGTATSLAITSVGVLYAWGDNGFGQVGNNSTTSVSSPVLVSTPTGTSWTAIAAGSLTQGTGQPSLAVNTSNQLFAWGKAGYGQIGVPPLYNALANVSSPVLVYTLTNKSFTAIGLGPWHGLAIDVTGILYAWGDNTSGQVGVNSLATVSYRYPTPVSAPANTSWSAVDAGAYWSLGLTTLGSLYSWGKNSTGQLGIASLTTVSSPVAVSGPAGSSWTAIAAGLNNGFAITTAGILYSWGAGNNGVLGNLSTTNVSSPVLVSAPAGTSWKIVSAAKDWYDAYAISTLGTLYAWGANTYGQVGNNSLTDVSSPVLVSGPTGASWSVVSGGQSYALAIATTGVLYGWGLNSSGQAGLWGVRSPVQVGLSSWNAIAAGDSHAMGISSAGTLYAWGFNGLGQLGDNTTATKSSPVLVNQPHSAVWSKVATGDSHMLAIKNDGSLWAWGYALYGQLGNLSQTASSSPVQVSGPAGTSWSIITAGTGFSLGITTQGKLYGWGLNTSGQVGIGTLTSVSSPVLVTGPAAGTSWNAVTAGQVHAVAITKLGKLYAWGANTVGQLGDGTIISKTTPNAVSSTSSFSIVASHSAASHTYAITTAGVLWAWGVGTNGHIGNNAALTVSSPVLVSGPVGTSWNAVAAGNNHGLAITKAGVLYAWGLGTTGQLGANNLTSKSSPVLVSGPVGTSWSIVAGGLTYSLAVTTTGALYGWGLNTSGQLAINSTTTVSSPVLVTGPTGRSWTAIAGSTTWGAGLTLDGSLYAWGAASTYGQTGQGIINISIPGIVAGVYTAPASNVSWTAIAAGTAFSLGITTAGALYGWGNNSANQTAVAGNTLSLTYPVPATGPVGGSWTLVTAGASHGMATTNLGVLWAWGSNTSGQLGINALTITSSPALVSGPANTSWKTVAAGSIHSLGITTLGVLYAWGDNSNGQLGNNSTVSVSSPVLVSGPAGASWSVISAGAGHSIGITTTNLLYAWGLNSSGQLGINSITNVSSPVAVSGPANTSWGNVAVGGLATHTFAITL